MNPPSAPSPACLQGKRASDQERNAWPGTNKPLFKFGFCETSSILTMKINASGKRRYYNIGTHPVPTSDSRPMSTASKATT